MKGAAVAAAIGAGVSVFFYFFINLGLRIGFAAADYRERRQAAREGNTR